MYEAYYEPTDADLLDWQEHCMMLDAEEMDEREEEMADEDDFDDSMDGDHESALESVYGPAGYYNDEAHGYSVDW